MDSKGFLCDVCVIEGNVYVCVTIFWMLALWQKREFSH